MAAPNPLRSTAKTLVLSPHEQLTAGGAAEHMERQIQSSLRSGVQQVIVDLTAVPHVDSAGIRALVRGHTSAQRLMRRLTIVNPSARVREEIATLRLQGVLEVCDTMAAAKASALPWRRFLTIALVVVVGGGLVLIGTIWPSLGFHPSIVVSDAGMPAVGQPSPWSEPLFEFSKVVFSDLVGFVF
jgi:anti-anti-sigma factor